MSAQYPTLVFPHELPYQNNPKSSDLIFLERPPALSGGGYSTYSTSMSALSAAGLTGLSGYSGYSGMATIITNVNQPSHGFSNGQVIRSLSAGAYTLALADTAANAEAVGIVTQIVDANNFVYTQYGPTTTGVPSGTAGTAYFLSDTTAGLLTVTEPTIVGHISKPMAIILNPGIQMQVLNMRGIVIGGDTIYGQVTINNSNTPYTVLGSDYFIDADCTVSPVTAVLPTAVGIAGKAYNFKKTDTTLNPLVVMPSNSQTIDGYASVTIPNQWISISIHSNGVNWLIH